MLNGATLIQSMLTAGPVDDLRLAVVPVLPDGAMGVHYRRPANKSDK